MEAMPRAQQDRGRWVLIFRGPPTRCRGLINALSHNRPSIRNSRTIADGMLAKGNLHVTFM